MNTEPHTITRVEVFMDDPDDAVWYFRAHYSDGHQESGGTDLDAGPIGFDDVRRAVAAETGEGPAGEVRRHDSYSVLYVWTPTRTTDGHAL